MNALEFRKKRLALGLSQAALGKRLGCSGHTILRWEREQVPLPLVAAIALDHIARQLTRKSGVKIKDD